MHQGIRKNRSSPTCWARVHTTPRISLPTAILMLLSTLWHGSRALAQQRSDEQQLEAKRVLREAGLAPFNGQWQLAEEPILRKRLAQLERLQSEIRAARKALETRRQENQVLWSQLGRQITALQKRVKSLSTDSKERRRLEAQLAALQRRTSPPDRLCGTAPVRSLLKQLLARELDALIHLLWTERTLQRVQDAYPQLERDRIITKQLSILGAQLGSAKPYRDTDETVKLCRDQVLVPQVSLFREAKQWRTGVILNESIPATVSWIPKDNRFLLATSLASAANVQDDSSRKSQRIQVGSRKFEVRPVVVPRVRFGSVSATDIKAWVLPPEAGDLGTRMGERSIATWKMQIHPERMRAVVTK